MNRVKLPEVCELIMGQSPDSTSYNKSKEGLPFYQGNANFGPKYPTPTVWCSLPKKIARNNDILISVRAPIGDLNFANEECCIGRGLAALRIKDNSKYSKEYLFAFLKSIARELQRKGTGSTFTAIGKTVLEDLEINILSLPEQQKIAAHLDSIQSAIDNKKQQLQQLDELVKSKFYELFEKDFLDKSRTCKMSDICTAMIGLTYKPTNVTETGTIVLRSGNIQEKELYLEDDIVRVSDVKIKDAIYIQDKDVLMCSRNGSARLVGKSCLIRNPKEKMTFGAFMTVIRGEYPYFIQGFLSSDFFKDQLTGVKTASVNQITTSMLYSYDTIKPDSKKETEFAKFVEKSDSAKSIIKTQLADLQELLDSKMDEYFGE